MSKYNVLVIPSGTGTAVEIWKSLRDHRVFTLFGADTDAESVGSELFSGSELCPALSDKWFWPWLESHVERHEIDLIMPTHDAFILPFAERQRVGRARLISPNPFTAGVIQSKARTYATLQPVINTPKMYDKKPPSFPAFMKPAQGRGSIGAHKINNIKEWKFYRDTLEDPICTEFLPGDEYTVDCLCDLNGRLLSATPRLRHKIKDGMTVTGFTVANKPLERMAEAIAKRLHLPGCWFFQAKESSEEVMVLLEVNARVAGTMCLTRAAGVNLPELTARLFAGQQLTHIPKARTGVKVSRHLTEIITRPPEMHKVKVVSWDLDDTILNGRWASSRPVQAKSHVVGLISQLHNAGISQYIVSKNRELAKMSKPEVRKVLEELGIPMVFENIVIGDDDKSVWLASLLTGLEEYQIIHVDDAFSEREEIRQAMPSLYTADIHTCYNLLSSLCRS